MVARTRIFLVDDHPLVLEWLASLIAREPDLAVAGQAGNLTGALAAIDADPPDLVVADLSLEEGSGLELVREIARRHPGVGVLVFSMHDEAAYVDRARRAGARGYVMKQESTGRIIPAIRGILRGEEAWSERAQKMLGEKAAARNVIDGRRDALPDVGLLSDRELEVFELIGLGRETREIAQHLGISFKTVQAYAARIKEKLGLDNATELLREALRWDERQSFR